MKSESILSITMVKKIDILSQLNFFMQENLVSRAHFTELRDHRMNAVFLISKHTATLLISLTTKKPYGLQGHLQHFAFCRDNNFLPSWKHLYDPKIWREISCLLLLKACGLTKILKTRLRGKCDIAYILSFVVTTALDFPAQGSFLHY